MFHSLVNAYLSYAGRAMHLVQGLASCAQVKSTRLNQLKIPSLHRRRQQDLLFVGAYLS